jgi:hypothetical protein
VVNELPDPPDDQSVKAHVEKLWKKIQDNFEKGLAWNTIVLLIEDALRNREQQLARKELPSTFDWHRDLYMAKVAHSGYRDTFDLEQRRYNQQLAYWRDYVSTTRKICGEISVEGLRTTVLIHGATILACLAALSGQYVSNPAAKHAAIVMFLFSLAGIICAVVGYGWAYSSGTRAANEIAWKLSDTMPYEELRVVGNVIHETGLQREMNWSERLVYASIGLFCLGAVFSGIVLLSE